MLSGESPEVSVPRFEREPQPSSELLSPSTAAPSIAALERAGAVVSVDGIFLPPSEGKMPEYFAAGARKCTTNPAILEKAISNSTYFDDDIFRLHNKEGLSAEEIVWRLAVKTVQEVADMLLPTYRDSNGMTGMVSLELSPEFANLTEPSLNQAAQLVSLVDRENLFIKVPGTEAGMEVGRILIENGQHVNWTLLFTRDQIRRATEASMAEGRPSDVRSVLSIFVSRPDRVVNALLNEKNSGLDQADIDCMRLMSPSVAHAKLAYEDWHEMVGRVFDPSMPRILWASLAANTQGQDLEYILPLVGRNTVFTVPPKTLDVLLETPADAIKPDAVMDDLPLARTVVDSANSTICFQKILHDHIASGCEGFVKAHRALIVAVQDKIDGYR